MHPTVVMLFTASVVLNGACGNLLFRAIPHMLTKNMEISKRQGGVTYEKQQCVTNKVDAAFEGNNSRLASDCKKALIGEFEITSLELAHDESSHFQSLMNNVYETVCKPDCGNVIMDAYIDCRVFDDLPVNIDGIEEFQIGLCGTNKNGTKCYEMVTHGMHHMITETTCFGTAASTETCTCSSKLSEAVNQQGCCINLYHELMAGIEGSFFKPRDLYYLCNVEPPNGCNNTPLTLPLADSTSLHLLSIITLISAFVFSTLLA